MNAVIPIPASAGSLRVLLIDDEERVLRACGRMLESGGHEVVRAQRAEEALAHFSERTFDVVVSDIHMPGMDGLELLVRMRTCSPSVAVVLMTGLPRIESAQRAIEHGAVRYLTKPIEPAQLLQAVREAAYGPREWGARRRGRDEARRLLRAIDGVQLAFQPIASWHARKAVAYEALLRTREAAFPNPGAVLEAAERHGCVHRLGRTIRARASAALAGAPADVQLFVNLHPLELNDPELLDEAAPLSAAASRVVLEITERARLETVRGLGEVVGSLRARGFRVAIDDLGAGYSGLASFAQLVPEVMKIDMSLVRGLDSSPAKARVVRALLELARGMGVSVVAEGVETRAERDVLVGAGCDLFQGFLFGRPAERFAPVPEEAFEPSL